MTRLIDADFLIKTLNEQNIPVDVRVNYEIMNAPTIEPDGDLISRQDAIDAIKKAYFDKDIQSAKDDPCIVDAMTDWAIRQIKSLPSEENESRLYIKIYADDEPSVKAEKLYQICGETQNREVAEWLKEYFPSAPDSRQRGEWVGCTGCEHYDQQQTKLICHECKRYYSDKYKDGEDK